MGLYMSLKKVVLVSTVAILFLLYAPNLLDIDPLEYHPHLLKYEGALTVNKDLDRGAFVAEGDVPAPEALDFKNGSLYASLVDGRVVSLQNDKVVKTFVNMYSHSSEPSRPLGIRFYNDNLYIVDGHRGFLEYNIKTETLKTLLPFGAKIEGVRFTLPDDLDIDDQGVAYISDLSTRWDLHKVFISVFEHGNDGRIVTYDIKTGKAGVLIDHLFAPNGIQLSPDQKTLIIAEFTNSRLIRYYLEGPKKGKMELFSLLPGEPDNLRPSSRGGYWVIMMTARSASTPHPNDLLGPYPKARKVIARLGHLVAVTLGAVGRLVSFPLLEDLYANFNSGWYLIFLWNVNNPVIVELDAEGTIVRSLHSTNPKYAFLTHPTEVDGHLYVGSFVHNYIVKIKL